MQAFGTITKDAKFGSKEADIMEVSGQNATRQNPLGQIPPRTKSSQVKMPPGEHSYITASALFCTMLH